MVPSWFVPLDELPLTANGKLDRRALPIPDGDALGSDEVYVAPRTEVERVIAGVWAQVLGIERVGVHDNFFALGGHSLMATKVVSRLREALAVELPVRELFDDGSVAGLARVVGGLAAGGEAERIVVRERSREPAPLSFAQQRLWFLDQLTPGRVEYVMVAGVRVRGGLDVDALGEACSVIVQRHEGLRTRFVVGVDGDPLQVVDDASGFGVARYDVSDVEDWARREDEARAVAEAEAMRPFDLAGECLFRVSVVRLSDSEHLLVVAMHHIVSDGWSLEILFRELGLLYEAAVLGQGAVLPEITVQYGDFALWQREWLTGETLERQLGYWRRQLEGLEPLELPSDRPRPLERSGVGAAVSFEVSADVMRRLGEVAAERGASLFMAGLAAFVVVLARWSGQEDVAVGSPIAGRNRVEVENLIGFFVNMLVLRVDLSGNLRFEQLLDRVREIALAGYGHQDLPFERLVEELAPERDLSRNPLFQVSFALENHAASSPWFPRLQTTPIEFSTSTAAFDLTLTLVERADGGFDGEVVYASELFDEATMARFARHFERVLEQVAQEPSRSIGTLDLLAETERRQILEEWSGAPGVPVQARCVHELVEGEVARGAGRTAVVFEGKGVSYGVLNGRANRIAHHLRGCGVGCGCVVAINLSRSVGLVEAVLGVLKAGAGFTLLDPTFPDARLAAIVRESGASVVVSDAVGSERSASWGAEVVAIDEMPGDLPVTNPCAPVSSEDVACVMFTSGSSGRPKGWCLPTWRWWVRCLGRSMRGLPKMRCSSSVLRCRGMHLRWSCLAHCCLEVRVCCSRGRVRTRPKSRSWWLGTVSQRCTRRPVCAIFSWMSTRRLLGGSGR